MMASSTPQKALSTPQRTSVPSLPPAIPPLLSPINIEIQREPLSRTTRGITITKEPRGEERIISQGGDLGLPRTSIFSFPYSSAFPSAFTSPPLALRPVPEVFTQRSERRDQESTTHVIEIHSSDVEAGLNQLLERVTQVYGGKGKVKVRRRLWGAADEKDPKKYSVKYLGPEKAAAVLEKALQSVKDLQGKSGLWKFTQRLEVSTLPAF